MAKRILLADDDADLTGTIRDYLEAKGYVIDEAAEGVQVIEKTKENMPDAIVLDWKMPMGKGSAVLEMLREHKQLKKIPVLILSGATEPGMKDLALSMGAKEVLTKPIDFSELLKHIQKHA